MHIAIDTRNVTFYTSAYCSKNVYTFDYDMNQQSDRNNNCCFIHVRLGYVYFIQMLTKSNN